LQWRIRHGIKKYETVAFLARYALGEKIDRMKFAGTLLVMPGIALISMSLPYPAQKEPALQS
jgi:hypothetical protein